MPRRCAPACCCRTRAGSFQYRKVAGLVDGLPVLAEIAFAYDPELEHRRVMVAVNGSPALMGPDAVPGMESILSGQYCDDHRFRDGCPVAIFISISGARLAFTDRGKSAVSL